MIFVSSNGFSHDQQVDDALTYLSMCHSEEYKKLRTQFTGVYDDVGGFWYAEDGDMEDPEYGSWLCDAIENTGIITWWGGEPVVLEEGDELD